MSAPDPLTWRELTDTERHLVAALSRSATPRDFTSLHLGTRVGGQRLNSESKALIVAGLRKLAGHGLIRIEASKGGVPSAVITTKGMKLWRGEVVESAPAPDTDKGLPFLEGVSA